MDLKVIGGGVESVGRMWETAEARWLAGVTEESAVSCGVVWRSVELRESYEANQWRLARVGKGQTVAGALAEVEGVFGEMGVRCASVTLAPDGDGSELVGHLLGLGYVGQEVEVLRLVRHVPRVDGGQGLSMVPARAMRGGYEEMANLWAGEWGQAVVREMAMAHLDDSSFEAMLVLLDGKVGGTGGVLSVGQVGRIENVAVRPEFQRRGVGRWMMERLIEMCGRAAFRHVLIGVEPGNVAAQKLYAGCGFEKAGSVVTYYAPWTAVAGRAAAVSG
jgi:ribosomal protein S18 acetylase RimI-like enzyme